MKETPSHRRAALFAEPLLMPRTVWEQVSSDLPAAPAALACLKAEADRWLGLEPLTVTAKQTPPPSGDLHDYTSMAPYFWPNPETTDGLPYIRRDGETNPEFYTLDNARLEKLCAAVPALILYHNVTGSEPHAEKAAELLRAWFLAPATRMNPNLRHTQFIRGVTDGRGIGIIDTNSLIFLLDAVTRLPASSYWTEDDYRQLQSWFAAYTGWLTLHPFGLQEESEPNNHGSWYDAQVIAFSRFSGREEQIARRLERTLERIRQQIRPDGSQPGELARTLSLTYSTYNLLAFACTAELTIKTGADLWNECPELKNALKYLKPYYSAPEKWSHPQIRPFEPRSAAPLLTLAAGHLNDAELRRMQKELYQPQYRILFSKSAISGRKHP